ncbi:hypothetical protein OUZ56_025404 [Daphnia magna]|uniref:Uncharacterized protein n=1 Tax=Daphnia magna TaxID=35525 RepID=A0ABQ9ZJS4_9CRUS|nr:hypothetical protein OUZ56_025404 [Daphnia magna]
MEFQDCTARHSGDSEGISKTFNVSSWRTRGSDGGWKHPAGGDHMWPAESAHRMTERTPIQRAEKGVIIKISDARLAIRPTSLPEKGKGH